MDKITLEDLKKIEIKIGKILSAEKVENADKLIKLEVDFGAEKRQIVTAMAEFYQPDYFIGKSFPFITNLEYRTFKGVESQGMVMACNVEGKPIFLIPEADVPPGTKVI
jgi:methionine--tRNA ligase beta chain